jgi:hypothetical protein
MSNLSVTTLRPEEFADWRGFVGRSPDGSVYAEAGYLEALATVTGANFRIVGVRRAEALVGGVPPWSTIMSEFAGDAAAAAIRVALERCNAGAVFGLPGGPNHALFQALRTATPRLIVPTHELAAAFMAGTYGRVDGRPGILLTIPGPGFAYALLDIAEAWQDSAPLVHIVSAPPYGQNQRHRHQALDQAAIVRPIVKAVFGVSELAELGETICIAYETARCGEPGPVVVPLGGGAARPSGDHAADAAGCGWGTRHLGTHSSGA